MKSTPRHERGSALLIVFVFAAMVAIMLYREMPVAAFEAQRQKEELLADRGNEYKRAIKLYVRRFQTFPPTVDALENTNRVRFLRNRYVDPFSGKKDDWRMLHAGPGGMITDSKIKPKAGVLGPPGSSSSLLSSSSSSGSPYTPADSSATATATTPDTVPAVPQRPPAIAVSPGGLSASSSDLPMPSVGSEAPMPVASNVPYPGYPGPAVNAMPGATSSGSPMDTGSSGIPSGPRFRGGSGASDSYAPPGVGAPNSQAIMENLLTAGQNPQQQQMAPSPANPAGGPVFGAANSSGMGVLNAGGGIAGVASKVTHHAIKVMNDQTNISLWEFVYDMRKEQNANAAGMGAGVGMGGAGSGMGGSGMSTGMGGTMGQGTNMNGATNNPGSTSGFSLGTTSK